MGVVAPWTFCAVFVALFALFYYKSRTYAWLAVPHRVCVGGRPLFIVTRLGVLALLHACAVVPLVLLTVNWKF